MSYRPLGDRVLVRREKPADRTPGGIHLPDTAKNKPQVAVVMAVGPGQRDKEGKRLMPDVRTGERVLLAAYAGTIVHDATIKEELVVIGADEILAVVE